MISLSLQTLGQFRRICCHSLFPPPTNRGMEQLFPPTSRGGLKCFFNVINVRLEISFVLLRKSASRTNFCFPASRAGWRGATGYSWFSTFIRVTFASSFGRWLDKLGLSARQGIDVVMRQVFFGAGTYHLVDADFEPLPVCDQHPLNTPLHRQHWVWGDKSAIWATPAFAWMVTGILAPKVFHYRLMYYYIYMYAHKVFTPAAEVQPVFSRAETDFWDTMLWFVCSSSWSWQGFSGWPVLVWLLLSWVKSSFVNRSEKRYIACENQANMKSRLKNYRLWVYSSYSCGWRIITLKYIFSRVWFIRKKILLWWDFIIWPIHCSCTHGTFLCTWST